MNYLKAADAAAYVRIPKSSLAKMRLRGNGPAFSKIGRSVRYSRADLDDFMARSKIQSTNARLGKVAP